MTALDREGAPALEWCEAHQRRHMAPGYGDPEPAVRGPGTYLTINYPPRTPRIAFVDRDCEHELLVITINGGRLCAAYAEEDLDAAARLLIERMVELNRIEVDISTNEPVQYDAHTFDCAHVEAHGTCSSAVTTQAGHVGPWHQLVELGWRRNGEGAWQCPTHSPAARS